MTLQMLPWDSARFGFPVARIAATQDPTTLRSSLEKARRSGVVLAYLRQPAAVLVNHADLTDFGGAIVARRATYFASIEALREASVLSETLRPRGPYTIEEFEDRDVSPDLIQLAREAGQYSRFRADPRVGGRVYTSIYDLWMARSVGREIADQIFVAHNSNSVVGVITVKNIDGARGEIGLLAVGRQRRGFGLGKALVVTAMKWAHDSALEALFVATQAENQAGCRVYETSGFSLLSVEAEYHFWLGSA